MVDNGLFADEQHGFVPTSSCSTQLLVALESWCEILDNGGLVDVIYTDFAKAYDTGIVSNDWQSSWGVWNNRKSVKLAKIISP